MVGSKIKIVKNGEIKIISEIEIIDGVEIFYMTDNTSYSSSEFSANNLEITKEESQTFVEKYEYANEFEKDKFLKNLIGSPKENSEKLSKLVELCLKNQKIVVPKTINRKKKIKSINIFGWTITFSKSK